VTDPSQPRETCFVCFKARATCVCSSIVAIDNRTGVFVLQHPRERDHPIGTVRFVDLGLVNSKVIVAASAARDLRVPMAVPPRTGLLFPRDDARDLEEVPADERPDNLLVLDGTWSQASTLYRRNPWLQALPHYRLSPSAPSRYRIRKEPRRDYVSTIESVLLALRILEPETTGFPALLAAFDSMIDTQVRHAERAIEAGTGKRHKRARRVRRFVGVPRWIGEDYERLVGVYAEALPIDDDAEPGPRHLLQLVAVHLSTGEHYERMVVPRGGLPSDDALERVGLCRRDFADAMSPDEVALDFARFVDAGRDDSEGSAFLAWNGTTPSLMHDATGIPYRVRLLKAVVRGLGALDPGLFAEAGPSPSLDRLVELAREGAPVTSLPFKGRAGVRLANLRSMAEWIRERARRG